ncbi:uncharacterized protein LOC143239097 [Tachypleus tridentatus]|uniref:uncharacterized protein LOC143239097 n=1 Tax=Tachypleus tridentatus TaxID=6853 RepID=UPI003FD313D7
MASFRVDEDDDSKQVALNFLDFSKLKIRTREDLNSALWKLPELRLRQEHVSESDIIILDKVTSGPSEHFTDPIPEAMRNIRIRDLSQVDIDWKMLTLARPLSKLEEDAFSRFIELDKLNVKTMAADSTSASRRNFSQDRIFHPLKPKPGLNIKSYSHLKRNKFCFEDLEEEKEHAMNQEFTYSFYERECKEEENQDLPELLALTENLLKPSKQKGTSNHAGNQECHTSKKKNREKFKEETFTI